MVAFAYSLDNDWHLSDYYLMVLTRLLVLIFNHPFLTKCLVLKC